MAESFPYCEVCGEPIKGGDRAIEMYAGTARGRGFFRNILGRLLKNPGEIALGTAHASCLFNEEAAAGDAVPEENGVVVRQTLFQAAGVELKPVERGDIDG